VSAPAARREAASPSRAALLAVVEGRCKCRVHYGHTVRGGEEGGGVHAGLGLAESRVTGVARLISAGYTTGTQSEEEKNEGGYTQGYTQSTVKQLEKKREKYTWEYTTFGQCSGWIATSFGTFGQSGYWVMISYYLFLLQISGN